MKSQQVRLFDIFVLGPWLVYLALRPRPLSGLERSLLVAAGAATVIYNGRNYAELAAPPPDPPISD